MTAATLTIQLPLHEIEFAKEYALQHGITLDELLARYLQRLHSPTTDALPPSLVRFTGIIPENVDVKKEYHEYQEQKHT